MKRLLLGLLLSLTARSLPAADIVALCIGNNAYQRVEDQLDTPINDAELMKRTLEALPGGADVVLLTDATKEQMEIALNSLKARAQGAKLALVFYSGHGTEDQPDGFPHNETFLLPVDAAIPDVNHLPTRAVSLSTVLSALRTIPVTARAVILDCCRDGAPRATAALVGSSKSFGNLDERVKKALGSAVLPDATLIAFAASPGRRAAAFLNESDENSPFTKFLTDQLATGTGNLRDLVEVAAENTEAATDQRQVPYVNYIGAPSAIRQIVFRTSPAVMSTAPGTTEAETIRRARELAAQTMQGTTTVENISNLKSERDKPETVWQSIELADSDGWKVEVLNGADYVSLLDVGKFYKFSEIGVGGKVHSLRGKNIVLGTTCGTRELAINTINFSTSLPVIEKEKIAYVSKVDLIKLIDPVLRPSHIEGNAYFNTVVLDPAGGGDGEPPSYSKRSLDLALAAKNLLVEQGFKVILTRNEGEDVSVSQRILITNSATPAIYVRLTFGDSIDIAKKGVESLSLTPFGTISESDEASEDENLFRNDWDAWNVALATAVHAMVVSRYKFNDLGVNRSQHQALSSLNCPAMIFKGGYLSNPVESKLIHSPIYIEHVAKAIAEAITNFKNAASANYMPRLQRELSLKGFYAGEINGLMSEETRTALIKWQQEQGLEASGELTGETLARMSLK